MVCLSHFRAILLLAAIGLCSPLCPLAPAQNAAPENQTKVQLRWGQRAGVSRYRLQLSHNVDFSDIVWDRVVAGNQIEIADLEPGRYFWRVASLTDKLGEFSSAGVIVVQVQTAVAAPRRAPQEVDAIPANPPVGSGGWRAAIVNISGLFTAHLRTPGRTDLVALNANGSLSAIDAASGVVLWNARPKPDDSRLTQHASVLIVPKVGRLDNLVLLRGTSVSEIEGATGRELWGIELPYNLSAGVPVRSGTGSGLIIIDESRQRLFIVSEANGKVAGELRLPGRIIGAPVSANDQNRGAFALAYESGDVELRDAGGAVIRSVNVGSTATTAPLFVRGRTGDLILLGTRAGLTAIKGSDLRALGRVAITNDAPRGTLLAQDLDGDGVPEVLMTTERGHLMAINAGDGKIIWDVPANDYGDSLSFADLNGDQILDVFVSGDRKSAMALSGRDGTVIWKDSEPSKSATNHAAPFGSRDLVAVSNGASILLITVEPAGAGLRALQFRNP